MTECMANEEYKFYKNGDKCDSKIYFEDWETAGVSPWTETTLFNTIEECCANLFWYDYNGCVGRSPATFKFDFCVDIKGLPDPQDCQSADIFTRVGPHHHRYEHYQDWQCFSKQSSRKHRVRRISLRSDLHQRIDGDRT